jgi:hypothetical protein
MKGERRDCRGAQLVASRRYSTLRSERATWILATMGAWKVMR